MRLTTRFAIAAALLMPVAIAQTQGVARVLRQVPAQVILGSWRLVAAGAVARGSDPAS